MIETGSHDDYDTKAYTARRDLNFHALIREFKLLYTFGHLSIYVIPHYKFIEWLIDNNYIEPALRTINLGEGSWLDPQLDAEE